MVHGITSSLLLQLVYLHLHTWCALCVLWLQEDDVIGLLPGGDDIAKLQPLQVGGGAVLDG